MPRPSSHKSARNRCAITSAHELPSNALPTNTAGECTRSSHRRNNTHPSGRLCTSNNTGNKNKTLVCTISTPIPMVSGCAPAVIITTQFRTRKPATFPAPRAWCTATATASPVPSPGYRESLVRRATNQANPLGGKAPCFLAHHTHPLDYSSPP